MALKDVCNFGNKRLLGLSCTALQLWPAMPPEVGFLHGVGSFDPLPSSVLIWTRWTDPSTAQAAAAGSPAASAAGRPGPPPPAQPAGTGCDREASAATWQPLAAGERQAEVSIDWLVSERSDFSSIVARWAGGAHGTAAVCSLWLGKRWG